MNMAGSKTDDGAGALAPVLRSMLFVPGDSERKLAKGASTGADALILDLEDAVAPARTAIARQMVLDYLRSHSGPRTQQLWVRINPVDGATALEDLSVVAGAPDGIVLPKVNSAQDVLRLCHYLDALEVREGLARGAIRILPVATETPGSMFAVGGYGACGARLAGLTWGAEDLAAALGASASRRPDGSYDGVYQMARSLCLLGAGAAGVPAIDTIWSDFSDTAGLEADAKAARRAGFSGKLAIHPGQVAVINAAFTPEPEELAWSKRVVEAFAGDPGAGTIALDGKMLDMPHLKLAQRVLGLATAHGT